MLRIGISSFLDHNYMSGVRAITYASKVMRKGAIRLTFISDCEIYLKKNTNLTNILSIVLWFGFVQVTIF